METVKIYCQVESLINMGNYENIKIILGETIETDVKSQKDIDKVRKNVTEHLRTEVFLMKTEIKSKGY